MPTIQAEWIEKHYTFLKESTQPIVACYGGAGSGKSYAICQELVERLFSRKGYVCLVIRKTGPSLLRSTWTMMLDVLNNYGLEEGKDYTANRSERSIKTTNGNIAWFISFGSSIEATSSRERIKSINATDAYIEEATELGFDEYSQIGLRLRLPTNCDKPNQLLLSFNPINPFHWTKEEIIDHADGKRIAVCHSTYQDNPCLPDDYERNFLEPYKLIDEAYYKMYALGEYAQVKNTIYNNYVIDDNDIGGKPFAIGVDFGYNNPSAIVAVWERDMQLYVKQLLYEREMTNSDLIHELKYRIPSDWRIIPVFCDSAEPQRIEELRRSGIYAQPAMKDVQDGIDIVKRYRLHLNRKSEDLVNEIRSYKWREDADGHPTDEPVKLHDHLCDALRYAVASSELGRSVLRASKGASGGGEALTPRKGMPGMGASFKFSNRKGLPGM